MLSTEYINSREKLKFRCGCGEKFDCILPAFKNMGQRQCRVCSGRKHSYQTLSKIVSSNTNNSLIDFCMEDKKYILVVLCECGRSFEIGLNSYRRGQNTCSVCSGSKYDFKYIKEYVDRVTSFKLVSTEYVRSNQELTLKCQCGATFQRSFTNIKLSDKAKCLECKHQKGIVTSIQLLKDADTRKNSGIPESLVNTIKGKEVSFKLVEEYKYPKCLKEFADGYFIFDFILSRITLTTGKYGYLCVSTNNKIPAPFIIDDSYVVLAKVCSKSGVMLPLTEFNKLVKGRFGVSPECTKIRRVERAAYRNTNKEQILKEGRRYYANNRGTLLQKHKLSNRINKQKRRLLLSGGYTDSLFMTEFENCPTRKCWLSEHTTSDGNEIHIEHLMPISVNNQKPYGNSETNCYYLLGSLNSSKGNKNVFDWIDSMSQSHLQFLLEDYPVDLSLQEFREGMFRIITGLAEKQGLIFDQYKEQYNKDYAEGLHEKAC